MVINPLLHRLFLDHDIILHFKTTLKKIQKNLRAIPEKNTWEGKMAGDIFFYGWLVWKVFKLYGSLVFDQI